MAVNFSKINPPVPSGAPVAQTPLDLHLAFVRKIAWASTYPGWDFVSQVSDTELRAIIDGATNGGEALLLVKQLVEERNEYFASQTQPATYVYDAEHPMTEASLIIGVEYEHAHYGKLVYTEECSKMGTFKNLSTSKSGAKFFSVKKGYIVGAYFENITKGVMNG